MTDVIGTQVKDRTAARGLFRARPPGPTRRPRRERPSRVPRWGGARTALGDRTAIVRAAPRPALRRASGPTARCGMRAGARPAAARGSSLRLPQTHLGSRRRAMAGALHGRGGRYRRARRRSRARERRRAGCPASNAEGDGRRGKGFDLAVTLDVTLPQVPTQPWPPASSPRRTRSVPTRMPRAATSM